jgi:hypothetical protein
MRIKVELALSCALVAIACGAPPDSGLPTSPTQEGGHDVAVAAFRLDNVAPEVVIVTTPRADADGRITGRTPLAVTFNTCPSADLDEGDRLRSTYDFDGDGTVDESGHCRATHVYSTTSRAEVCVSDRQPDHRVCRSFSIEAADRPARTDDPCGTLVRAVAAETEPNDVRAAADGPFDQPTQVSATLAAGGDTDWYEFVNTCTVFVFVQARTFGPAGRHDCSAPADLRMNLSAEYASGGGGGRTLEGTTCSSPYAVGLNPGDRVWFGVEGAAVAGAPYQLQLLTTTATVWDSRDPLE